MLASNSLERHTVENRLQHAPTINHRGEIRAVLARLVIGDTQGRAVEPSLHQIDRAANQKTPIDERRIRHRAWVPIQIARESKRELEPFRTPVLAVVDEVREPAAKIARNRRKL